MTPTEELHYQPADATRNRGALGERFTRVGKAILMT